MIVEYIKKCERRSILSSAIMILIAILLMVKPETMISSVMIVLGICLLIDGAYSVILFVAMEKDQKMFSNALVEGMVEIIIAFVVLINSNIIVSILTTIAGIWIIIKSIIKIQFSISVKSVDENSWIWILITAMLTLALGVYMLIQPFSTVVSVAVVSGVFLLITGIIEIVESIAVLIKLK